MYTITSNNYEKHMKNDERIENQILKANVFISPSVDNVMVFGND
jgi:hypothetical protein